MVLVKTCSVDECERAAHGRGLCFMHYKRWRKANPGAPRPERAAKRACSIDDCGRPVAARGWCIMHWKRWWKHGDPLVVKPGGNRSAWTGDAASYRAVHKRLSRERGAASLYVCTECNVVLARDWAFDEPIGYSTDLSRYRPLCRPCHLLADRGVSA